MNYQKMMEIDPFALDVAWKNQPVYAFQCSEALAHAKKDMDLAKDSLDILMAQVNAEIRDNAEKKLTEKAIEAEILLDTRVQDAKKHLIDCRHTVGLIEAAKSGFENRRAACENLVKLHAMSYYAEPTASIEERGQLDNQRVESAKNAVQITPRRKPSTLDDVDMPRRTRRSK